MSEVVRSLFMPSDPIAMVAYLLGGVMLGIMIARRKR